MKLLVSGCIGWSFVYMLNNTGDSTLPCGSPLAYHAKHSKNNLMIYVKIFAKKIMWWM